MPERFTSAGHETPPSDGANAYEDHKEKAQMIRDTTLALAQELAETTGFPLDEVLGQMRWVTTGNDSSPRSLADLS